LEKRIFSYFLFNKINKNFFRGALLNIDTLNMDIFDDYSLKLFSDFYLSLRNIKDVIKVDFKVYFYSIFPLSYNVDFMVWIVFDFENEDILNLVNNEIFKIYLRVAGSLELVDVLWGFTKPSVYSKASKSPQEIDPFDSRRKKFLTVYPFVKTPEWYLLKQDTRQGMMNEHIRIGRQYPEILQLLLYCFGLSNNEFVVVYEMDSIVLFDKLVYDLRQSEARKYTLRDTPIYTGIYTDFGF
jgi:chlorite dismutase